LITQDGYTYEREAVQGWIRARLPPTAPLASYVQGPKGDKISMNFIPNKSIRAAIERWRTRRESIKNAIQLGRKEQEAAKRLLSALEEARVVESKSFERVHVLSQFSTKLNSVLEEEQRLCKAVEEKEIRIQELEKTLRELRASQMTDSSRLDALNQERVAIKQSG